MKRILFIFVALFAMISAKAQIATENSKLTDNIYIGVGAAITTPLDFNSMTPFNTGAGLKIGKDITPTFGFEVEGGVLFNDNHFGRFNTTFVRLTNVGLNGKINLNNLFDGYNGSPRFFEVSTNVGLGWMHYWDTSYNTLTAKTGVDVAFNLSRKHGISLVLSPAIYWNLHNENCIQFNRKYAQLALAATFVYHFKNSNKTHSFKTYDVGAMVNEISRLNEEVERRKVREREALEVAKKAAVPPVAVSVPAVPVEVEKTTYIFFAKNSDVLTDAAKETLKNIKASIVSIKAFASPEGTDEYNKKLSERRAAAVKDFLTANTAIGVASAEGCGVSGDESPRAAIITAEK